MQMIQRIIRLVSFHLYFEELQDSCMADLSPRENRYDPCIFEDQIPNL